MKKIIPAMFILSAAFLIFASLYIFNMDDDYTANTENISKKMETEKPDRQEAKHTQKSSEKKKEKKEEKKEEKADKKEEEKTEDKESAETNIKNPLEDRRIVILSYHSIAPKGANVENSPYQVSYENFETQLSTLKKNGYSFIDDNMLYNYYYNGGSLPKKPVMITFDDGRKDMYQNGFPLLKKYGAKASVYIICTFNDKYENYLTSQMIRNMVDSGLISIQIHSYAMHKYIEGKDGKNAAYITVGKDEDEKQYEKRISNDIKKAKHYIQKFGKTPVAITYPFGKANDYLVKALKDNKIYLGYVGFNQRPSRKDTDVYHLLRYNVNNSMDTEEKFEHFIENKPMPKKEKPKDSEEPKNEKEENVENTIENIDEIKNDKEEDIQDSENIKSEKAGEIIDNKEKSREKIGNKEKSNGDKIKDENIKVNNDKTINVDKEKNTKTDKTKSVSKKESTLKPKSGNKKESTLKPKRVSKKESSTKSKNGNKKENSAKSKNVSKKENSAKVKNGNTKVNKNESKKTKIEKDENKNVKADSEKNNTKQNPDTEEKSETKEKIEQQ